jgi:hypothetical protein
VQLELQGQAGGLVRPRTAPTVAAYLLLARAVCGLGSLCLSLAGDCPALRCIYSSQYDLD